MANERITVAKLREAIGDPGLGYPEVFVAQPAPEPEWERTARQEAEAAANEAAAQVDAERKAAAKDQRQRDEDAALADADEIVRRMRARLGRKVCSPTDGRIIREIWERLKAMPGAEITSDDDPSFRT